MDTDGKHTVDESKIIVKLNDIISAYQIFVQERMQFSVKEMKMEFAFCKFYSYFIFIIHFSYFMFLYF